jgi:hypothetical protein
MARIVFGISSCIARSRADSPPFLSFPFEHEPPLCDPLRDLFAPAPEERADRNAKRGFVSEPGFEGRSAVPGFVARHLHACRGAKEIGKSRLSQMCVAAITAKVIIEWPSVKVCHGSAKNRRLAGSSVESETFREGGKFSGRQTSGENLGERTTHDLKSGFIINQ